jgi:uncharacterized protein
MKQRDLPAHRGSVLRIVAILFLLAALCSAGFALYVRFTARPHSTVPHESASVEKARASSPAEFTGHVEPFLRSIASGFGIPPREIRHKKTGDSSIPGVGSVYTVNVPSTQSLALFHMILSDSAVSQGGSVLRGVESADGQTLALTLGAGGTATDGVMLKKIPGRTVRRALLAVVIVGVGEQDIRSLRALRSMGRKVTLSIRPGGRFAAESLKFAGEAGYPVMLDISGAPGIAMAKGAAASVRGRTDDEIAGVLDRLFDGFDRAEGIMLDREDAASFDAHILGAVMDRLRGSHRYFFDGGGAVESSSSSAQRTGTRYAAALGAIDGNPSPVAIRARLHELAESAFERGPSAVVGQYRAGTVAVLLEEMPRLAAMGVKFVPLRDVVR